MPVKGISSGLMTHLTAQGALFIGKIAICKCILKNAMENAMAGRPGQCSAHLRCDAVNSNRHVRNPACTSSVRLWIGVLCSWSSDCSAFTSDSDT